jgi:hypothetical protein
MCRYANGNTTEGPSRQGRHIGSTIIIQYHCPVRGKTCGGKRFVPTGRKAQFILFYQHPIPTGLKPGNQKPETGNSPETCTL